MTTEAKLYADEQRREQIAIIKAILKGHRQDLAQTTGVIPGQQLPTGGTDGTGYPPQPHATAWGDVIGTPTTLTGYGITDAASDEELAAHAADTTAVHGIADTSLLMTNPMITQDDLIVGGSSGVPDRLAKGSDGQVLTVDPTTHHLVWSTPSAAGVTSVGLSLPSIFSVTGSPVTGSGTLAAALANESANVAFAGPVSGAAAAPTFRALVADDIPSLDSAKITSGEIPRSPLTTRGDLLTISAIGGLHQRVGIGAAGRYLRSDGNDPRWSQLDMGDAALGTLPLARGGTGVAALPAFLVHKNGTGQTGIATATFTLLTWSSESVDNNNNFASNRFTPTVAGTYMITLAVYWDSMVDQSLMLPAIYKNGAVVTGGATRASGAGDQGSSIVGIIPMNGSTDYLEAYAYQATGSNKNINGNSSYTYFAGAWIGP